MLLRRGSGFAQILRVVFFLLRKYSCLYHQKGIYLSLHPQQDGESSKKTIIVTKALRLDSRDRPTSLSERGIEWSLRAFAKMRAVCLFLRAGAVINFFLRAASTLESTDGEQ